MKVKLKMLSDSTLAFACTALETDYKISKVNPIAAETEVCATTS